MADINLQRGAKLAAQIIAEGGDWRDLDGALNRELQAEGRYEPGLDKYYDTNVEIGADQADLQAFEAGRTDEDGSSRLRRRTQQAIADLSYEQEAKTRGESSEGKYLREQGEQASRRARERKIIGGSAPSAGTSEKQLFEQIQTKLASGELQGDDAVKAQRLLRSMSERVNPRAALLREADQGRAAVRASGKGFDPKIRAQNQAAASSPVGRFIEAGNDERIGEVISAESGYKDYMREVPILSAADDPSNYGYADLRLNQDGFRYTDPSGNPLAIQGPQMPSTATTASSSTNMPTGGAQLLDLMEREQFSARKSGTYPQVDIGGELAVLTERLNALGVETPGGIRNLDQAQALFDEAISTGQESGAKFNAFGSKEIVDNPGADELLAKMRYSEGDRARLSNALIQMELGNRQNVNLDQKAAFQAGGAVHAYELARPTANPAGPLLVGPQQLSIAQRNAEMQQNTSPVFGAREAMGDFSAGPELEGLNSRVKPRMAGLTGENIEGSAEERAGALEGAQRNYQGLVKDEPAVPIGGKAGAPNLRYNKTGETSQSGIRTALTQQAMERAAKTGKKVNLQQLEQNVLNAQAVQGRADEFDAAGPSRRAEAPITDELGKRRQVAEHIGRPKPEMASTARPTGLNTTELQNVRLGGEILSTRPSADQQAAVNVTVSGRAAPRSSRANRESSVLSNFGVTQNEAAAASAPQAVGRNNEPGRRIGNDIKNELAALNSGAYQGNPTRPLTDDLRSELNALGGADSYERPVGPTMKPGGYERSFSERAATAGNKLKGFATSPRYQRGRRVGAGLAATGGIGALIGGERERREQEQYQ